MDVFPLLVLAGHLSTRRATSCRTVFDFRPPFNALAQRYNPFGVAHLSHPPQHDFLAR
jgi:hypothetical protein